MAVREVSKESDFAETGTHPAVVASLKDQVLTNVWDQEERGYVNREVIEWTFGVLDSPAGEPKTVTTLSSRTFSRGSKAGKWVKNLLGSLPSDEFDDDSLVGKPCMVKVVNETKTTQRGTFTNSKVEDVQEPLSAYTDQYDKLLANKNEEEMDDIPF